MALSLACIPCNQEVWVLWCGYAWLAYLCWLNIRYLDSDRFRRAWTQQDFNMSFEGSQRPEQLCAGGYVLKDTPMWSGLILLTDGGEPAANSPLLGVHWQADSLISTTHCDKLCCPIPSIVSLLRRKSYTKPSTLSLFVFIFVGEQ